VFSVTFKVFLTEYAGPLAIYLLFYARPALIYGAETTAASQHTWASQLVFYDVSLHLFL